MNTVSICFIALLIISTCSLVIQCESTSKSTILRVQWQHVLASLPPSHEPIPTYGSSQPFLESPSGKYTAVLMRRGAPVGVGAYDLCYVQVQDRRQGLSVWESDCALVSDLDSCSLVFTEVGLEMFDDGRTLWEIEAFGFEFGRLDLDDDGDLSIRDEHGEIVWMSSEVLPAAKDCAVYET